MKRSKTRLALGIVAAAMAMTMTFAATASARTVSYDIWNLSSETLRVSGVSAKTNPPGEGSVFVEGPGKAPAPSVGELLRPSEHLHIVLERPDDGAERIAKLVFAPADALPNQYAFYVLLRTKSETDCTLSPGSPQQCEVSGGGTIHYLDPAGHKFEIGANDIIGQRKAITDLCDEANSCKFHPEKESEARSIARVVGTPLETCQEPAKTTLGYKDGVETTNSFGVKVEAGINFFEIYEAGITLSYGHKRTESKDFSQDVELDVPKFSIGWVTDRAPVIRDAGTYTLTLGNTQWIIKDVYFDSPDPDKTGIFGTRYKEMDEAEQKQCIKEGEEGPDGGGGKLTAVSPAVVQTFEQGAGAADLLRGYAESNEFHGLAGSDLLLGGGGHDSLFGGGGHDWINGGKGEDTISGGSGADHIVDQSGPTEVNTGTNGGPGRDYVDVRDGKGDDKVTCGSPASTVVADRRDQIDGQCGRVIRV